LCLRRILLRAILADKGRSGNGGFLVGLLHLRFDDVCFCRHGDVCFEDFFVFVLLDLFHGPGAEEEEKAKSNYRDNREEYECSPQRSHVAHIRDKPEDNKEERDGGDEDDEEDGEDPANAGPATLGSGFVVRG
jgi:hypothetical protein